MKLDSIEIQLKTLPQVAGVYQFFDSKENIIYVGKAKNLKKRVASYFNKNLENHKTKVLVKKIKRIELDFIFTFLYSLPTLVSSLLFQINLNLFLVHREDYLL